ncbi:hypothetical protein NDI43_08165 [Microcoleus vaginatus GB2-A3]|uniref:hypothetical protein n=1 Tax=Microcoleus vaginatus TaxID=119532 RepID=UPI0032A2158C
MTIGIFKGNGRSNSKQFAFDTDAAREAGGGASHFFTAKREEIGVLRQEAGGRRKEEEASSQKKYFYKYFYKYSDAPSGRLVEQACWVENPHYYCT